MAMDILSIPITTVASESTFSAGGRVIDKRRASMRRDTIEVLLCGGDWIKEAYGIRTPQNEREQNDSIELENEREYEMTDPPQSNPSNVAGDEQSEVAPQQSEVAQHPTKRQYQTTTTKEEK
ncbi:hypothetical protein OROGR_027168 [Orobanche gracilis]